MTRTTIDYGIDLGTSTSVIAVLNGVETEIIKNNEGSDTTPSAVRVDRSGRISVGRGAKERSEADPEGTAVEFKQRMGTSGPKLFASGRSMEPEELSAEVLRSLLRDVAQRKGEEVAAAVITVPAAFDLSSCDATERAARLAGLAHAPLLQEPTAAALAHGFQSTDDNTFWLVYDLGGGTFDAAIVRLRDGEFTVVNHRGNNSLGGKLLDWAIVDELLIPEVVRLGGFTDLRRGNAHWRSVINKLKLGAEAAKVELSAADSALIEVSLHNDAREEVPFEYELRRASVEPLFEPLILQSVNLCRRALEEEGLGPGDIEKVLLVGGPTLSPYLRERLADPREGLGVPLDFSHDPITVVARGAAVFAGAQRLPESALVMPPANAGEYTVELEYSPTSPEPEPFVGGKVHGENVAGCSIEFVNPETKPPWRGGRIPLGEDGIFSTTLWAERGRTNVFDIELTASSGARLPIAPSTLSYTIGGVEARPRLNSAIGVALADNKVDWLVERGTPLTARRHAELRTTASLSRGQNAGVIRIPIVEGENARADRNRRIGRLEIVPEQISRDVPEGSLVEFTILVDTSRLVTARAYVPFLDEEFEHVVNLRTESGPDPDELARDLAAEKRRLAAVRAQATDHADPIALAILARIDAERVVEDLDRLVDAAQADQAAAADAAKRLLDLRTAVDEAEDELAWPQLVRQAQELLPEAREIVTEYGGPRDRSQLEAAESQVRAAITAHDADLLRQRIDELVQFVMRVLDEANELPYMIFRNLEVRQPEMVDQDEAARLIRSGQLAVGRRDADLLRQINIALSGLLPPDAAPADPMSTVRKAS